MWMRSKSNTPNQSLLISKGKRNSYIYNSDYMIKNTNSKPILNISDYERENENKHKDTRLRKLYRSTKKTSIEGFDTFSRKPFEEVISYNINFKFRKFSMRNQLNSIQLNLHQFRKSSNIQRNQIILSEPIKSGNKEESKIELSRARNSNERY